MKLASIGISLLLLQMMACSGAPPAATEYKKQLSAGGGAGGGGGGGSGDATAGKAFLKSNCESCHVDGGAAIPLTSTEVAGVKSPDGISAHSASITDKIKANQKIILAALGGDSSSGGAGGNGGGSGGGTGAGGNVQTGLQIVMTTCSSCHAAGKAQPPLAKASAGGVEAAGKRPSHSTVAASFAQSADIIAYLNSL